MANAPKVDSSKAAVISRLQAQKILALQAGKTKAAALIQVIIDRLSKK